jgi:hypothetical protein
MLFTSTFRIGKKRRVPVGMVISRTAVPETLITPARKKMLPWTKGCPTAALSPVSSKSGFSLAGMEYTHCHQAAASSWYYLFGGMTPRVGVAPVQLRLHLDR